MAVHRQRWPRKPKPTPEHTFTHTTYPFSSHLDLDSDPQWHPTTTELRDPNHFPLLVPPLLYIVPSHYSRPNSVGTFMTFLNLLCQGPQLSRCHVPHRRCRSTALSAWTCSHRRGGCYGWGWLKRGSFCGKP